MAAPNEITPTQLNRLLGTPDAPIIIDLRIDEDFDDDPRLIPTAFRHSHQDLAALEQTLFQTHHQHSHHPNIPHQNIVVYCQKGRKISQGAAAGLRVKGFAVEVLEGGQFAWRDAGLPMINASMPLTRNAEGNTVWVTRHRPKIDRLACPWLIRRFVDPKAEFLFVPPQDVELVAEKFAATPFDIEGVQFSHRGELCSFDAFLQDFGLVSDALNHMALVIRGADTNNHDLTPQSAGLLAFSVGLSRMYKEDLPQLDAGMLLYDALFRWARDGMNEGHDWPLATSAASGAASSSVSGAVSS